MRLSWPFIHSLGSLSNYDDADNNNVKKQFTGFMSKTTALHVYHAFWYISLTSTARLRRETSQRDVLWRTYAWTHFKKFSLLYLNMDKALENLTPGKVTHIWRIERFQIDVIKFKRRKFVFFFFCDVFTAVVVVAAYGPYYPLCWCGSSWERGEKRKRCSTWTLQKGTLRCSQPTHALGH